jgi:hypothetical protein
MNPEDVDPEDYGQEYFSDLVSQFEDHPDWRFSHQRNILTRRDITQEASEFQQQELFIDHEETDGRLNLTVPHAYEPVLAAIGSVEQPLDGTQRQDPYEDSFGEEIQETYQSVVEGHDAEYMSTDETDPLHILQMRIPLDYDEDTLNETLTAASDVSKDIQQVNDEVTEVLEKHR